MSSSRFLATVLFTDIVGSTDRAAELGDGPWRKLLEAHHARARAEIARHGGRELSMTGDGFLATFDAPERALRCACAIRTGLCSLGLEIRGGVHTGEVEVVDRNVGGLAVHIAARVLAAAGSGEILVSHTTRDLAAGAGFELEDRGAYTLKGVPGEWRLSAVTGEPVMVESATFWQRAREARLPRVLLLYLLASGALLGLTAFLQGRLDLPSWVVPAAVLLLVIGLAIIAATAWVQAHPLDATGGARQAPGAWEVDLPGLGRSVAGGRLPHLTWGRALLGGAVAFSLLFGLAGLLVVLRDRGGGLGPRVAVAEAAAPGLAVLPFDVRGADLEVWREGMVDVLSTSLDGAGGLRAIDSRTVLARWREAVEGDGGADLATSLEVARRAGARYALVGNVVSSGSDLRLNAEVYNVPDGASLGTVQVEGSPDSMFVLVDQLAIESLGTLLEGAEEGAAPNLARITTTSLPALKAFLEGESRLRRSDFIGAAEEYHEAVTADSTFAFALYRLAQTYGWSPELAVRFTSQEYYEQAARHAERLNEREGLLVRAGLAFWRGNAEFVENLQDAVRKWPDEAEAWYELGEFFFHMGDQLLVPVEEAEEPFLRAVELDPSFAPFQIHLMNLAFTAFADSTRARRYIDAYEEIAPTSGYVQGGRTAYALVFGDSAARSAAWAVVDTLPAPILNGLAAGYLDHPRFWDTQEVVLESEPRPRTPDAWVISANLVSNKIGRGKLRDALAYLSDPYSPAFLDRAALYRIFSAGLPVPAERLEERLALGPPDLDAPADSLPDLNTFFEGAYAGDQARWDEHAEARRRLTELNRRFLAAGDSAAARAARGLSTALEGQALWRRGDRRAALPLLQDAQREAMGQGPVQPVNATLRQWLGELLLQDGRPAEAVRWLESLRDDPLVAMQLGRAYEELGEYDKARERYAFLAAVWEQADPELQPRVAEARAAAQRLTSAVRE